MKNLKKFGAVALAAVMTLTFAPVASLSVKAAGVTDADGSSGTFTLSQKGSYKVTGGDTLAAEQQIELPDSEDSFTLDLNGHKNVKVTVASGATKEPKLTVINKNSALAKLVMPDTETKKLGALSIGENIATESEAGTTVSPFALLYDTNKNPSISGAVATVNEKYIIGNAAINAANVAEKTGADIVAYAGNVVIQKLGHYDATEGKVDGAKSATIAQTAKKGTTLKATATPGASLVKVETKYHFYYEISKDGTKINTGNKTWTDDAYYAGASKANLQDTISDATAPAITNLGSVATDSVDTKNTVTITGGTYERAITLTPNSHDKFDVESAPVTPVKYPDSTTFDSKDKVGSTGITYFTSNPVKYVDTATYGVALLDGSKYVVYGDGTDNPAFTAEAPLASKSIEIVRGLGYSKDDKNKGTDTGSFQTQNTSVTIAAPDDTNIITLVEDDTDNSKKVQKAVVYGYEVSKSYDDVSDSDFASKVTVQQIAKGKVAAIDGVADTKKIATASGIGYFYQPGYVDDTFDYTFGATEDITKEFTKKAVGSTTNEETIDPEWTDELEVFASKEIVTDLKGVADTVTFKGEASAEETAKDEEKHTKDWAINKDQKPEVTTTKVYRFNNTITGEHIYTSDAAEVATLQGEAGKANGWVDESADKNTFKVLPATSNTGVEVYRLFNSIANKHFYTTNKAEADAAVAANVGWKSEGVAFKAAPENTTKEKVPVYRMRRPSDDNHLFTPDTAEVDWLKTLNQGWEAEGTDGIAFYAFK